MKIFISWSGERSKAIALALRDWLKMLLQETQPWMSAHDMDKGVKWIQELGTQLKECNFGICCLTPENQDDSWLHFEAGAVSKPGEAARMYTLLYEMEYSDVHYPLASFQHTKLDKGDMRKLVGDINKSLKVQLETPALDELFNVLWEKFEAKLKKVPPVKGAPKETRSPNDMIPEILELVRGLANRDNDSRALVNIMAYERLGLGPQEEVFLDNLLMGQSEKQAASAASYTPKESEVIMRRLCLKFSASTPQELLARWDSIKPRRGR